MSGHKHDYDPTELCTKAFKLSLLTFKLAVGAVILGIIAVAPHVLEAMKSGPIQSSAAAHTLSGESK